MRVDPSGSHTPITQTAANPAARPAGKGTSAAGSAPDTGAFTLTEELAGLLAAVRQAPEVRAAVVESVAARFAAGEFGTPEAAADAARNLLSSGDAAPPADG